MVNGCDSVCACHRCGIIQVDLFLNESRFMRAAFNKEHPDVVIATSGLRKERNG